MGVAITVTVQLPRATPKIQVLELSGCGVRGQTLSDLGYLGLGSKVSYAFS